MNVVGGAKEGIAVAPPTDFLASEVGGLVECMCDVLLWVVQTMVVMCGSTFPE